jgi:NADH-quinone oxidoreductase subunit N
MNSADLQLNLHPVLPELLMVATAAVVMILDMFNRKGKAPTRALLPWVALVGVLVTAAASIWLIGQPVSSFQGMAINDARAQALNLVVLAGAALTVLLSIRYIPNVNRQTGEYYALILLVSTGMMAMGSATDLMALFLALETFSLGLYILAGLNRTDRRSNEAAMKPADSSPNTPRRSGFA